jgi:hypothetical protein
MVVSVLGIVMAVRVRMSCAIGMNVWVLVENDLEAPPKGVGDAAEGLQARNMIAPLQPGDHGLRHPQTRRQLLLRLAGMGAQLQKLPRAVCG